MLLRITITLILVLVIKSNVAFGSSYVLSKKTVFANAIFYGNSVNPSKNADEYLLFENNQLEQACNKQRWIIILFSVFFAGLSLLTISQITDKKRLRKAYQKIREDANFIAEQNEEIKMQIETIKRKNIELNKYRAHLEKLDKNRTNKLNQAVEKAKESERLKSSLLSNIYHEIRTPLNAIVGFTQLLNIEEDIENRNYLDIIEKNADDLLVLVDNIIELSKIQAGSQNLFIDEIDVSDFLKNIYHEALSIKNVLRKDQVKIQLTSNNVCENTVFYTDKEKIYKILKHLIDNAFKYTDNGYIEIGCLKSEKKLQFYIKDTGIGIKKNKLSSIFNAFQKIEDHNNLYRGVGIGLTIARHFTEQIGGILEVESEINKGTKFVLEVPDLKSTEVSALQIKPTKGFPL